MVTSNDETQSPKYFRMIVLIIIFGILITACSTAEPTATSAPPTSVLQGASVPTRIPTEQPTATQTPTITPTQTATQTATSTATPTLTATATVTSSPAPTATSTTMPTDAVPPTVNPTQVSAAVNIGDNLFDLGQYTQAVDAYTDALALEPDNIRALLARGFTHLQLDDFNSAKLDYERILEIDENNLIANFNLGFIAGELGNYADALDYYDIVLQLDPEDWQAYAYRAQVLVDLGQYDEAIENFTAALNLNPEDPFSLLRRGYAYYDTQNNQAAYEDFTAYVALVGADEAVEEIFELIADLENTLEIDTSLPERVVETGEISNGSAEVIFTFVAAQGEIVNLFMNTTSGNLDPLLILQTEDGEELAVNDDDIEGTGRNSAIRNLRIPTDGNYQITASRFQQELGTTTGEFELVIEFVPPSDALTIDPVTTLLTYGQAVTGSITNDVWVIEYRFEATAGDIIGIRMDTVSGTLDPLIELRSDDGALLAENDDDPESTGRNSYLRQYAITQSGTYIIGATRFQREVGSTTGDFELEVDTDSDGT